MNDNITFGFSRDSARVATIFRIAPGMLGTVVNGLGTVSQSSRVEVFAKVPTCLGSTAADALNAAQRGITLNLNLLLLVSDLRDRYDADDPSRSLPASELVYRDARKAVEELARRRAAGWEPNLPTN